MKVSTNTTAATDSSSAAASSATAPPMECPTSTTLAGRRARTRSARSRAMPATVQVPGVAAESPWPGRSGARKLTVSGALSR